MLTIELTKGIFKGYHKTMDKFTTREKKIIHLLYLQKDNFVSGKRLSTITGVTERTIRKDIKNINQYLITLNNYNDFHIESYISKGYKIIINNVNIFKEATKDIKSDIEIAEKEKYKFQYRVIRLIILLNKKMSLTKLSYIVGYSEQIIVDILRKNNKSTNTRYTYSIKIKNENISIRGNELYIRNSILSTIFVNPSFKEYPQSVKQLITDEEFESNIYGIIIECLKKFKNISVSDLAVIYITKWLFVSYRRESFGNKIFLNNDDVNLVKKYTFELTLAQEIIESAKGYYKYYFDENDIYILAALIASFGDMKENGFNQLNEEVRPIFNYILYSIQKDFVLDNIILSDIKQNLSYYFRSFDLRIHFKINRQYLGITRVKRRLIVATEYCRKIAKEICYSYGITMSDKEIIFLAINLADIFEKSKIKNKKKILIVSKYGYFEAKRYATNLLQIFGINIDSIDLCEKYEVNQNINGYDIILTDDNLLAISGLGNRYWAFSNANLLPKHIERQLRDIDDNNFLLDKLTDVNFIINLKIKNKYELFKYLANLYKPEYLTNDEFIQNLLYEENLMTFECGHNTALLSFVGDRLECDIKFYLLNKAFVWNLRCVQLIIVCTGQSFNDIQKFELGISKIICDTMNVDILVNNPSVKVIKNIINNYDSGGMSENS